jgi:NAD(P)-dependent dehydrogenase (short-subunit alcohol dehydrogenase family)
VCAGDASLLASDRYGGSVCQEGEATMGSNTLAGKVALITGAGRGFGRATAQRFAEEGASLVLNYRASREGCEAVIELTRGYGGEAIAVQADVADSAAVAAMIQQALEVFGRIDILVNNSGIMHIKPFAESDEDSWHTEIDVNVFGPLRVTRAVVPHMIAQRYGKIINLSSQLALIGSSNTSVYAGTKGFILTWTKSLARELGQYNINVNAIGPGSIPTDMNVSVYPDEESKRKKIAELPLRRMGTPRDVAESALFLASDASAFLTGQMLGPNGGNVM